MTSIEDVYNRLQKEKRNKSIIISLSEDKNLIEIYLSPLTYITASDNMIEIYRRKRIFKLQYWTSSHWHPNNLEELYKDLLKYCID